MLAKKIFANSYMGIALVLIYIPIAILILFSFNNFSSQSIFGGFSLQWFDELFQNAQLWQSVFVSVFVAIISTIASVIIGTFAALGLSKCKKTTRQITLTVNNLPIVNADIVTAVSLLLLFGIVQFNLGIVTLILAHISFSIPLVVLVVLPKTRQIQNKLLDASSDLGAKPIQTLFKVILPLLWPAILTGAVLAFAASFNDFIISFFIGGTTQNISTFLFTFRRFTPLINAFSAILVAVMGLIVVLVNIVIFTKNYKKIVIATVFSLKQKQCLLKNRLSIYTKQKLFDQKKLKALIVKLKQYDKKIEKLDFKIGNFEKKSIKLKKKPKNKNFPRFKNLWQKTPKKSIALFAAAGSIAVGLGFGYQRVIESDLIVAAWGQYIDSQTISEFERESGKRVSLITYSTNEELLSKLRNNSIDVVMPSDYAAAQLIEANRVLPIPNRLRQSLGLDATEQSATPLNFQIIEKTRNYILSDDPDSVYFNQSLLQYQIPYFWGNIVLAYNPQSPVYQAILDYDNETDDDLLNSWDVLFPRTGTHEIPNEYANLINMLENARLLLSFDTRNIFTPAGFIFNDGSPNATSSEQVDIMFNRTTPYAIPNRSRILADELTDVASGNTFDIAVMYNGDAVLSNKTRISEASGIDNQLVIYTPDPSNSGQVINVSEGTNVYEDGIMALNTSRNSDLSFDFIEFVMREENQFRNSSNAGYTAVNIAASNEIIDDNTNGPNSYPGFSNLFNPNISDRDVLFTPDFIQLFAERFNQILAQKE